jgi:hypothetical protein
LNGEQKSIFDRVQTALRSSITNFRLLIHAEGGTGKTHLLKLLALLIRNTISEDALLIAAPTGKAAFPIKGSTCHRIFGLQVQHGFIKTYEKLNSARLSDFRAKYRNVKWIFIDEISMVSYENFRAIHLRLCEIFGTDGCEPFAGKNVIIYGDILQLPPPKACKIFKKPNSYAAEPDLWRQFMFTELTINMRQKNDPLAKICSELRLGILSEESLKLLKSRELYKNHENVQQELLEWAEAIRIYPENAQCDSHNDLMTKELKKTRPVFHIKAKDTYADGVKQGQKCPDSLLYSKIDKTGGIPGAINLGIGSRVLLRRNLNTDRGYVNGATGIVEGIEWWTDRNRQINEGDLPRKVKIKFDHENEATDIRCTTVDFVGKNQTRICREILPFVLCWACTVHKLQGAQVEKGVVYAGRKCRTKGLIYVAISRVTSLEGLGIVGLDEQVLLNCPADLEALAEIDRLRSTLNRNDNNDQQNIENEFMNFTKSFAGLNID